MEIRFEMYRFWLNANPGIIEKPVLQNNPVRKMQLDSRFATGRLFSYGSRFPEICDNSSLNICVKTDMQDQVETFCQHSTQEFCT
jgi:hypothetical protein